MIYWWINVIPFYDLIPSPPIFHILSNISPMKDLSNLLLTMPLLHRFVDGVKIPMKILRILLLLSILSPLNFISMLLLFRLVCISEVELGLTLLELCLNMLLHMMEEGILCFCNLVELLQWPCKESWIICHSDWGQGKVQPWQ